MSHPQDKNANLLSCTIIDNNNQQEEEEVEAEEKKKKKKKKKVAIVIVADGGDVKLKEELLNQKVVDDRRVEQPQHQSQSIPVRQLVNDKVADSLAQSSTTIPKIRPSKVMTTMRALVREMRQQDAAMATRIRNHMDKQYIWPYSFPNCKVVDRWIRDHFFRTEHAKCLILIGPTDAGKTSFAMALPGPVNYYSGRWCLDTWNDHARYSVYDDIPWDKFEKLNFPNKMQLLTQHPDRIPATDKYRHKKYINVAQPAIILLNPADAGSLLRENTARVQHDLIDYWKEKAVIYNMGRDEYFARPTSSENDSLTDGDYMASITSITTNDPIDYRHLPPPQVFQHTDEHDDETHSVENEPSATTTDDSFDYSQSEEFQQMYQNYYKTHSDKNQPSATAATTTTSTTTTTTDDPFDYTQSEAFQRMYERYHKTHPK
ncbi:unnamed protein product [Adineta ricciae]|uniref:Replication-associated protein n=1 Tax=Adineta ricciae TaxID=249248 RepID=A0A814TPH0_ADIRI|nr:unnamed protein product [Adineta ricciae]CAF1511512.1 unnamed protein product [Adineta ricciae]